MHAASVNPEPGSNSLKNSISNEANLTQHLLELFSLACSYFLSYFQSVINEISAQPRKPLSSLSSVLEISCCSIFNERFALGSSCPLAEALVYYTKFFPVCQGVFENFFNFFIFAIKSQKHSSNCHNFTLINLIF